MSRFFPGQKVRITDFKCVHDGAETSVRRTGVRGNDSAGSYTGVEVELKNGGLGSRFYPFCVFRESELTPITDRPALAEWSDCAWSPHRVGVGS